MEDKVPSKPVPTCSHPRGLDREDAKRGGGCC